jgi:hypothetical protein
MQRQSFWRLYARLISFHRAARNRRSVYRDITRTSVSPILAYTAVALFLILAILEVDLHRDELRALGLVSSEERVDQIPAGP